MMVELFGHTCGALLADDPSVEVAAAAAAASSEDIEDEDEADEGLFPEWDEFPAVSSSDMYWMGEIPINMWKNICNARKGLCT